MPPSPWFDRAAGPGARRRRAPGAARLAVRADDVAPRSRGHGGAAAARLLSLWARDAGDGGPAAAGRGVRRRLHCAEPACWCLSLPAAAGGYVSGHRRICFPAAGRMQRAVADLTGLRSGDRRSRPWLRHGAWPADFHPLGRRRGARRQASDVRRPSTIYAFVRVEGDGVHEIAVGPVHAGIIEPGHFRFSVVGEKVLRAGGALGYVHKGIERRFTEFALLEGHRLAARVSAAIPPWPFPGRIARRWRAWRRRAAAAGGWLRALALELERCANHLGRSRRARQRRRIRLRPGAVLAPEGACCCGPPSRPSGSAI